MAIELSWFIYSISATICFGIMTSLFKIPTTKKISKLSTALWSMLPSLVLSLVFFNDGLSLINSKVILYGTIWGFQLITISILQMWALHKVETNTLFPTTTTASLVITLLLGMFFFNQGISTLQIIGMLGAVLVVGAYTIPKEKITGFSLQALIIAGGIVSLSVIGKIVQKIAVDQINIHALQTTQWAAGLILALAYFFLYHKKEWNIHLNKGMKIGLLIGIIGFVGNALLLTALSKGPFPLITSIHSTYVFVTALIGFFIFKEHLTTRKTILILLALVAIILMRLG